MSAEITKTQEELDMEELLITEEEQEEYIRFIEDLVIENEIMAPDAIENSDILTNLEVYAGHFLFRDNRYWNGQKDFLRNFHIKLCHINVLENYAVLPEFIPSLRYAIERTFMVNRIITQDNITITDNGMVFAGEVYMGFLNKNPKSGQEDFIGVNQGFSFEYDSKMDFASTLIQKVSEYENANLVQFVENSEKIMTSEDVVNLNRDRKIETVSRLYNLKKFGKDIAEA